VAYRLLALDARVLVVVAAEGVRRVALEVRLLHAGDRRVVPGTVAASSIRILSASSIICMRLSVSGSVWAPLMRRSYSSFSKKESLNGESER
jgi:hypothetical protein